MYIEAKVAAAVSWGRRMLNNGIGVDAFAGEDGGLSVYIEAKVAVAVSWGRQVRCLSLLDG